MYLMPIAAFDNGMRQVTPVNRPVAKPEDLSGMKVRVPPGQMIFDTFQAFGAQPVTTPANQIYGHAQERPCRRAEENPLAILEGFKLYEVVKYVSMTNHMWSGYNQMAHLDTWKRVPDDIKAVIERNVAKYVRQQREDQGALNASLRQSLTAAGLPSMKSTRRHSAPSCRASTPIGRASSEPRAGRFWKRRWGSSDNQLW